MRYMVQPRLIIDSLSVAVRTDHEWRTILKDISLTIETGETVALTGPSGSGKTTLIQLISGILPRHNYHISAGGMIYTSHNKSYDLISNGLAPSDLAGKSVTMVYQDPDAAMNPVLQVKDILKEVCPSKQELSRMHALLDELGLPPHEILSKYPFQLSGGQKQRILLALALFPEPELLIADEPTSALDRHLQFDFLQLIHTYKERHPTLSILFITHDLKIAKKIANRLIILREGRIHDTDCMKSNAIDISGGPNFDYEKFAKISVSPFRLRVEDLAAGYSSEKIVLNKVNFTLTSGELLGVAGPSGSGKSTLLRSLLGLMPNQKGQVTLNDELLPYSARRSLGQLIYQDPDRSFNPVMSIGMSINEILRSHPTRSTNIVEFYIEALQLPTDTLMRMPHTFSGGQKQRIAILRALLAEPFLLLCDEPFSSLDIGLQHDLMELLRMLSNQSGMGIIIVAHDLPLLAEYCDRIIVINDGEPYWEGVPSALYESADSWLKELVGN